MPPALPPFRLNRVRIRDFRAIDDLELELPADDDDLGAALVIAGENGCGKTSVLEAILLALGRIDLLPADTAAPRDLVRHGAVDFRIEAHHSMGDGWFVTLADVEKLEQRLRVPGRDGSSFGATIQRKDLADTLRSLQWGAPPPPFFSVESFSARREPEDLGEPASDPRGRRSPREERRLAELKRRLVNVYAKRQHNPTFERIERYMRAFLGERWSLGVVFRDAELGADPLVVACEGDLPVGPDGQELTLLAIRERAGSGEAIPRVVPIDRLSSGQMAILALAYPFVFGDRPVDLALLDEPEQHLQPMWQRALLPALRDLSPTTRFLAATHSPQVLDSVAPHERLALEPLREARPLSDAAE